MHFLITTMLFGIFCGLRGGGLKLVILYTPLPHRKTLIDQFRVQLSPCTGRSCAERIQDRLKLVKTHVYGTVPVSDQSQAIANSLAIYSQLIAINHNRYVPSGSTVGTGLTRQRTGTVPVKVAGRAVVDHLPVVLHAKILVTVVAAVELELVERLVRGTVGLDQVGLGLAPEVACYFHGCVTNLDQRA